MQYTEQHNLVLMFSTTGQTYRMGIMEHFNRHDLQKPMEEFVDDDSTTICKLKLIGPFTFYDNGEFISTVIHWLNIIGGECLGHTSKQSKKKKVLCFKIFHFLWQLIKNSKQPIYCETFFLYIVSRQDEVL